MLFLHGATVGYTYVMAIWCFWWQFWYFFRFGLLCQEKSGSSDLRERPESSGFRLLSHHSSDASQRLPEGGLFFVILILKIRDFPQ
jgi:hypothetical protein